jgi:hypothetical protein
VQYVGCVLQASSSARKSGLLTAREAGAMIKDAALNLCWWGR